MHVQDLQGLADYSAWANRKLFAVVSQLTPEQFTQSVGGSYGSVRNTLVHTLSADWGWVERCGGPTRGPKLDPNDFSTPESLVSLSDKVERFLRQFLASLRDDDLDRHVEFVLLGTEKWSMPIGELMQHALLHGVHHRGQAALLLRMLGYTPGMMDMLVYFGEKRAF